MADEGSQALNTQVVLEHLAEKTKADFSFRDPSELYGEIQQQLDALQLKDAFVVLCDEPNRLECLRPLFDDAKGGYTFSMEPATAVLPKDVLGVGV